MKLPLILVALMMIGAPAMAHNPSNLSELNWKRGHLGKRHRHDHSPKHRHFHCHPYDCHSHWHKKYSHHHTRSTRHDRVYYSPIELHFEF